MNNSRILIIDDEEIVRDSIRGILQPEDHHDTEIDDAAALLFDEVQPVVKDFKKYNLIDFEISEASNGQDGLRWVQQSIEDNAPFAVIFIDMRMPGWDGLTTAVEIRKIDPKAQIYFVTAYSDQPIEEIARKAGRDVGYLNKPFNSEEILQIATKGIYDWQRLSNLEKLLEYTSQIGFGATHINTLLENILHQISDYVGTSHAIMGYLDKTNQFVEIARIGVGDNRLEISRLMQECDIRSLKKVEFVHGVLVCPLREYCILAVPNNKDEYNQEKIYLLHLFIENAVRAIKNSELSQELVRNQKLSAVGQAISMVLHDIKTPIGQIQSMAEFIQEDLDDKDGIKEMAELIQVSTDTAFDLVQDILDFVNDKKIQKEPTDVKSLFVDCVEGLYKNHHKLQVEINLECPDELKAELDVKKIKRVIANLVNNSVEASISQRRGKTVAPVIEISISKKGRELVISISDNGPGIPASIVDKLFDPFVTSGKPNGSGLGLAIVKQVIDSHEGSIQCNSSDQGAEFIIKLPC